MRLRHFCAGSPLDTDKGLESSRSLLLGHDHRIWGDKDRHGEKEDCSEEKGGRQQEGCWKKEGRKEAENGGEEEGRFQEKNRADDADRTARDFVGQRAIVARLEQVEQSPPIAAARNG